MSRTTVDTVYAPVFDELDSEEAAALKARAQLLLELKRLIEKRDWSQADEAEALGVKQPRISKITGLRVDKFSVELLLKYLDRLGYGVTIALRKRGTSS